MAMNRRGRQPQTCPSPRNLEIFEFCKQFLSTEDEFPPMWAIAKHFGFRSATAAQTHIDVLAKYGLLERNSIGNWRFVRSAV